MTIEIDQSVKIEQTSKDTVLAMSGMFQRTILIPAKVKRKALRVLKKRGKSRNIARYQLFAAGLFILLRPYLNKIVRRREQIMIDVEYTGQDDKIKGMLLRYIRREGHKIPTDSIFFARVGKSSNAHQAGWKVQRGQTQADYKVSLKELDPLL
jgi:hypothetical protein